MVEGAWASAPAAPLPHKQMVSDNPIAAANLPLAPTMPCHQLLAYEAAHFCRISCMS